MDKAEKFEHWLRIAEEDLKVAEAIYASAYWLHSAFMCQQAIEKIVKGLYILYIDDNFPRVHNISQIIEVYADQLSEEVSEDRYALFEQLTSFYLETRYPEYKSKMYKLTGKKEAGDLLKQTKEVFAWLLTMKPSIEQ